MTSISLKKLVALCTVCVWMLSGCVPSNVAHGHADVQEIGRSSMQPLQQADMRAFAAALFQALQVPATERASFQILDTKSTEHGTYVLYTLPHNDGLAFAGRQADGSILLHKARWPLSVNDPSQDLVVMRAIPPTDQTNPPYGVLAGRVLNPNIEHIEVNYRDGQTDRVNVSHNHAFLLLRQSYDPRFVQVRGYGMNGNGYWSLDTR